MSSDNNANDDVTTCSSSNVMTSMRPGSVILVIWKWEEGQRAPWLLSGTYYWRTERDDHHLYRGDLVRTKTASFGWPKFSLGHGPGELFDAYPFNLLTFEQGHC